MRYQCRSLARVGCLLVALVTPAAVFAIGAEGSVPGLQTLVSEARELLELTAKQVEELDAAMSYAAARARSTDGNSRVFSSGGSYEYSQLKRSATRLAEVGDRVRDRTARCGEEERRIGLDFKTSTRRLLSDVNRVSSASNASFGQMAVDKIRRDVEASARQLQVVAGVPKCAKETTDDEDDASDAG